MAVLHSTAWRVALRSMPLWPLLIFLPLADCGLDTGGTRGEEWITSLTPSFACARDEAVASWDDRIRCSPGAYGSGAGGGGPVDFFRRQCPPFPEIRISDSRTPETVYVSGVRDARGSRTVHVDPGVQFFFNANPVVYSAPGTGVFFFTLPRHIHTVDVIPPDRPHIFAALADGTCTGGRPGWTTAVIDVRPGDVRSTTTRAVRLCNRSSIPATFVLGTEDGRTLSVDLGPGNCSDMMDPWPADLAEVTTRGSTAVGISDCSPTRGSPPPPIAFDLVVACPVIP